MATPGRKKRFDYHDRCLPTGDSDELWISKLSRIQDCLDELTAATGPVTDVERQRIAKALKDLVTFVKREFLGDIRKR